MRSALLLGLIGTFLFCGFLPTERSDAFAKAAETLQSSEQSLVGVLGDSLKQFLPSPGEILGSILSRARKIDITDAIDVVENSALLDFAHRVEFAVRKADPRLCKEFDPADPVQSVSGFDAGDLLAFCLASVTREPGRCAQIDPVHASTLRTACEYALVEGR